MTEAQPAIGSKKLCPKDLLRKAQLTKNFSDLMRRKYSDAVEHKSFHILVGGTPHRGALEGHPIDGDIAKFLGGMRVLFGSPSEDE